MILIHTTTTNSELNILTTIKRKSVAFFFTVKVPEMLENIWVTDSAICELSKDN